jgi:magnesium-transporting ATPase (P-type)
MSRWDAPNYDSFEDEEESRLLKKFRDYAEIEKKESERKQFLEVSDKKRPSVWGNRFVLSAIIQGAVITGLTVALVLMQAIFSDVSLIEFLSLSLDGPAKWFFFGYFMYITLVVSIAICAMFYTYLESNLSRPIRGNKKYLVWAQLIGMNVGGAATILLIITGFVGAGFVNFAEGSEAQTQNIMKFVKLPITALALVFGCGVIAGGIAYITTYISNTKGPKLSKLSFGDDSAKFDRL